MPSRLLKLFCLERATVDRIRPQSRAEQSKAKQSKAREKEKGDDGEMDSMQRARVCFFDLVTESRGDKAILRLIARRNEMVAQQGSCFRGSAPVSGGSGH
jgi:hypothetical protein